ncbi:MAG: dihydroneopterin aldolase [Candidatus Omnitrophica bacterium]|nr:dihydroneopterin aldolase [Candidatus Omnitrophota bacterium]
MKDKLVIHDLAAEGRLGVFDWEQAKPQPIWIDLELEIDVPQAAARDDVHATIDYGRLVTAVKQHVQRRPYRLLETLAEELAAVVLNEFLTPEVTVRVKKRALPGLDYAAVEITRRTAR